MKIRHRYVPASSVPSRSVGTLTTHPGRCSPPPVKRTRQNLPRSLCPAEPPPEPAAQGGCL